MRIPAGFTILSGGQTGADRAALDWALAHGVPHGGWCPRGRRAEDGPIAARYQLRETPSEDYLERTTWNVRDSDGTVILSIDAELTGGSLRTEEIAEATGKPCLHLSEAEHGADAGARLAAFVRAHAIRVLNVAGPRASGAPGIGCFVTTTLEAALG